MWLKLNEENKLKTQCADKYLVRDYINDLGYAHLLNELYHVYEKVEDINFEQLPDSFVMKCTHGSSYNIICPRQDHLDLEQTKAQLKKWMNIDFSLLWCEPQYANIKPRIVVERFLNGEREGVPPIDYKIHCMHGEPHFIEVIINRGSSERKNIVLNTSWEILPFNEVGKNAQEILKKPEKLDEMLEIAGELSQDFTYVRVDLYYSQKRIFFGELTFTPSACLETDYFEEAFEQMGKYINLELANKGRLKESMS